MDDELLAQFQQINTTYASMVPALIRMLVMRGSLTGSEAGELFRQAERTLMTGPTQGPLIAEAVAGLGSMVAWADAAKRQGQ